MLELNLRNKAKVIIRMLFIASSLLFSTLSLGAIWQVDLPAHVQKNLQEIKQEIPIEGRHFFAERSPSIHLASDLIQMTSRDKERLGYSLKEVCSDSYQGGSCILGQKVTYGQFFEQVDRLGHSEKLAELVKWLATVCSSGCSEYEVALVPGVKALILFTANHDQAFLFYHSL